MEFIWKWAINQIFKIKPSVVLTIVRDTVWAKEKLAIEQKRTADALESRDRWKEDCEAERKHRIEDQLYFKKEISHLRELAQAINYSQASTQTTAMMIPQQPRLKLLSQNQIPNHYVEKLTDHWNLENYIP